MKLDKLKELAKAGTSGPWTIEENTNMFHAPVICSESGGLLFQSTHHSEMVANAQLVATLRNHFDALLEVAKAAEEHLRQYDCMTSYGPLNKALEKLEKI